MRLRREFIAWRELEGEGVLLDLRSSRYLSTNPVGTMMVGLLQDECTIEELVDAVATGYEADRTVVARDVDVFLDQLRDNDLLEA